MLALTLVALAPGLTACAAQAPLHAQEPRRPDIVLFMIDDLGWQDVSEPFHTSATDFNERYHTPHIESLARRGIKFTQAYAAAPVCTPTRTSLMTGRSPGQTHITYWTLHADKDQSAAYPQVRAPHWNMNALQSGDVTLPGCLSAAGYHTIHAGKAHFGARGTSGADPRNLGFDVNIAGHAAGGPGSYLGTRDFRSRPEGEATVWDVPGLEAYHDREIFLTEALTEETVRALERAAESDRPFFLHFAPYAVHAPITSNARYAERYADLPAREAAYATMIETVDAAIGEIVKALERLNRLENTILVFTSDNGGLSAHARDGEPHTHNAPLRSGKGSAYEGGIRVPQIIAWPGVTDDGGVCAEPVITYDLFPTILAWAGAEAPGAHRGTLEGTDLAPFLRGETIWEEPRALFWHQPHFWGVEGPGIWPFSAVRLGEWKLIFRHGDRGFELYDLARDLGETNDLAATEPDRVRLMAGVLSAWIDHVDAQMSIDLETSEPIGPPSAYAP